MSNYFVIYPIQNALDDIYKRIYLSEEIRAVPKVNICEASVYKAGICKGNNSGQTAWAWVLPHLSRK